MNIPEAGDIISFNLSRVRNKSRSSMWTFVLSILDMGAPQALVLEAVKYPDDPGQIWRVNLLSSKGQVVKMFPIDVGNKTVAHDSAIPYKIIRKKTPTQ